MRKQFSLPILYCLLLCSPGLQGVSNAQPSPMAGTDEPTIFQHLNSIGAPELEVTIETDMKLLLKNKYEEEYQPATFIYKNDEGETMTWEIELRARGVLRKEVCYYPPVKLKFKDPELAGRGMSEKHSSLKLVHQCKTGVVNEQYTAKEMLCYRLYNLVTPESFRVRSLRITYLDTGRDGKAVEMIAFLIEDLDEMADRLDGQAIRRESFGSNMLESEPYLTMSVFQYMIGNTDWAVGNLHNLELIKLPQYRKVLSIPYDFDYAGLVNTSYAVPAEKLPIQSVTQRLYRGPECNETEARKVIGYFLSLETEIMNLCETFPLLDDRSRSDVIHYVSKFFEELKSPRSLIKSMETN